MLSSARISFGAPGALAQGGAAQRRRRQIRPCFVSASANGNGSAGAQAPAASSVRTATARVLLAGAARTAQLEGLSLLCFSSLQPPAGVGSRYTTAQSCPATAADLVKAARRGYFALRRRAAARREGLPGSHLCAICAHNRLPARLRSRRERRRHWVGASWIHCSHLCWPREPEAAGEHARTPLAACLTRHDGQGARRRSETWTLAKCFLDAADPVCALHSRCSRASRRAVSPAGS